MKSKQQNIEDDRHRLVQAEKGVQWKQEDQ